MCLYIRLLADADTTPRGRIAKPEEGQASTSSEGCLNKENEAGSSMELLWTALRLLSAEGILCSVLTSPSLFLLLKIST